MKYALHKCFLVLLLVN